MALVVFLRGVNVGGHRTFRPSLLAQELRRFDAINIGTAGTFVVRKPGTRASFLAALRRKLPFGAHIAMCDARDIARLSTTFATYDARPPDRVRFVSLLTKPSRKRPALPLTLPTEGDWLVRVETYTGRFVLGEYRRHMRTITCLGQLDALFGAPLTTRSWSTVEAIMRVLAKGSRRQATSHATIRARDPTHGSSAPKAMRTILVLLAVLPGLASAQAAANSRPGKRALLPVAREIALARSAAPAEVSRDATVYVLTDTGYAVAVSGTNGNTCLVDRSWPDSLEPQCFDPEASATIMQTSLVQMAGIQQGRSSEAIDRDLADGLRNGRFRLPTRPAMSYMMSSAQRLIGDDGKPAGNWQPHLMLFMPYMTSEQLGLGKTPNTAAGIVVDSGKPTANLMVIVKKFVDPEGTPAKP